MRREGGGWDCGRVLSTRPNIAVRIITQKGRSRYEEVGGWWGGEAERIAEERKDKMKKSEKRDIEEEEKAGGGAKEEIYVEKAECTRAEVFLGDRGRRRGNEI